MANMVHGLLTVYGEPECVSRWLSKMDYDFDMPDVFFQKKTRGTPLEKEHATRAWVDSYEMRARGVLAIHFTSAWNPPADHVDALARQATHLDFLLEFDSVESAFHGMAIWRAGKRGTSYWEDYTDEEVAELYGAPATTPGGAA